MSRNKSYTMPVASLKGMRMTVQEALFGYTVKAIDNRNGIQKVYYPSKINEARKIQKALIRL